MKARFAGVASILIGTLALPLSLAPPANASIGQCPANRFCVWTGAGSTGSFAYFAAGSADLSNPIGGVVFDNKISSVYNRTGQTWCMYLGYNYGGDHTSVGSGGGGDLAGTGFNNAVSSLRDCP